MGWLDVSLNGTASFCRTDLRVECFDTGNKFLDDECFMRLKCAVFAKKKLFLTIDMVIVEEILYYIFIIVYFSVISTLS